MIYGRYAPRPECEAIEQVHNKHHCYVPPEVWGISAETVCQVCQLKNQRLFVEIALELAVGTPLQEFISKPPPPVPFPKQPILGSPRKERMCSQCGTTQLWIVSWNSGERICGTCRQGSRTTTPAAERTCRFCGQQNVYSKQWRRQERMCSKKDCWQRFLAEHKAEATAV